MQELKRTGDIMSSCITSLSVWNKKTDKTEFADLSYMLRIRDAALSYC